MTRNQLLALAALLSSLGAGVYFVSRSTGQVDRMADSFGALEVVDRSSCTSAVCATQQCTAAQNIFDDAGSGCTPRFIECGIRVGQRIRDIAADAGTVFGPGKYQRVRVIAARCPAQGGGFALGVPVDDNQWPVFATAVGITPACARAPVDGGGTCTRDQHDGGSRYFGAGNVFPAADAVGPDCQPVECGVFFGDNPDVSL